MAWYCSGTQAQCALCPPGVLYPGCQYAWTYAAPPVTSPYAWYGGEDLLWLNGGGGWHGGGWHGGGGGWHGGGWHGGGGGWHGGGGGWRRR